MYGKTKSKSTPQHLKNHPLPAHILYWIDLPTFSIFHEKKSIFMTFIKNVCQLAMKQPPPHSAGSEKNQPLSLIQKITPPPLNFSDPLPHPFNSCIMHNSL